MKNISFLLLLIGGAVILQMVSSAPANDEEVADDAKAKCIANGKRCKWDGLPYCCSGYCYQKQGEKYGVCKKKKDVAVEKIVNYMFEDVENDVKAKCIANGKRCKWDGLPYCCSGYCYQKQGEKYGVCKKKKVDAVEKVVNYMFDDVENDVKAKCIANGKRCKWDGLPYCCSGYCYQKQGEKYGVCKKKKDVGVEKIVNYMFEDVENDVKAKCIANGKRCKWDGLPYCCSGYCYQKQGEKYGVCKKKKDLE